MDNEAGEGSSYGNTRANVTLSPEVLIRCDKSARDHTEWEVESSPARALDLRLMVGEAARHFAVALPAINPASVLPGYP